MKKISFRTLKNLNNNETGLTDLEVITQRSLFGENEIIQDLRLAWFDVIRDTLKDPMIWFLLGIGIIFIIVGDLKEGVILLLAIVPLLLMDAFLHWRTQSSTQTLKGQLASSVTVVRSNKKIIIDSRELVPGDLIELEPGLFLPADGIFEKVQELQIDESTLTGEAQSIIKKSTNLDIFSLSDSPDVLIDPLCLGYAGTRVLTGTGRLRVIFTGAQTKYGEIVRSVSNMPQERTPLQKSITKLVQGLIWGAVFLCLILAAVRIYQGHTWLDAFLSAATLAMAAIPEEFPVVFTFFLGVGVYRLAKKHALVRRSVSVENIGRITYICTDKTGTITAGRLTLAHLDVALESNELDLLINALYASNPEGGDPVDLAILEVAKSKKIAAPTFSTIFPFTEDRKRETRFVFGENGKIVASMKGAPEFILNRTLLSDQEKNIWHTKIQKWAKEGHKILGLAKKILSEDEVKQNLEPDLGYQFVGLLIFEDPARPEVKNAIKYCHENNIGVLMITGDHPDTAFAIAQEIGLGKNNPKVINAETQPQFFTDSWIEQQPLFFQEYQVVSRCTPLQKLFIVNSLKKSGESVAVTGDGVNDVPALKASDIGIAMGERGSKSAKEVASIILADDNFSTITRAIEEGRQLFYNLKKSFNYLLLFHIPFVLTAAIVPLLGFSFIYLPVHIVWLELVIHPTALFAFLHNDSIRKTPGQKHFFFSKIDVLKITVVGILVALIIAVTFIQGMQNNQTIDYLRSRVMIFINLWSCALVVYLSKLHGNSSKIIVALTVLLTFILIQSSYLSKQIHLLPVGLSVWFLSIGIIIILIGILKISDYFLSDDVI